MPVPAAPPPSSSRTPRRRPALPVSSGRRLHLRLAAGLAAALLLAAGCTFAGAEPPPEADDGVDPIRIGAASDAETLLLAHVLRELVALGGLPVEVVQFSSPRDARQALEFADVDLIPAYTGEAWLETVGRGDPSGDPLESFTVVRLHDEQAGLVWIRPRFGEGFAEPPANATFAFVVAGPPSIDADLRTMSQLAARLSERPEALVCVDQEFGERPDGLRAVLRAYSVRADRAFLAADPVEAVRGVRAGDCLAGLTTTTDGAAWRSGLQPLVDDLRIFPAFVPLPVVRADALERWPELRPTIGPMATQLTTQLLGGFNARVAAGEPVTDVAADAAAVLAERAGRVPVPASAGAGG
jgi:osmoprotectant transport system substrate-binding protein